MLGYPLNAVQEKNEINARKEFLTETSTYKAWRYQLEVMPNFWFYGILYIPTEEAESVALVIAQHGGGGTPEILGGLVLDSANYNHMVERTIRKGVAVFAPQLLSWNAEIYGSAGYDREMVNKRLVQLGGSITALEVYCISRVIDYFSAQKNIDENRIGMIGLSYGGMFTLFTAAFDERIKAAYSSCWFSDRRKHNWYDWVYFNQENLLFDAEVASLILPRKLFIEVAINDEAFPSKDAEVEKQRLEQIAKRQGFDKNLEFSIFEGTHELNKDNAMLERFVMQVIAK